MGKLFHCHHSFYHLQFINSEYHVIIFTIRSKKIMPKKGYRMTEEHRQKISISHVGFRKKEKKGWIHNGRKVIYDSEEKREVLEHRYIMEKHIGRKLLRTEIIHHINENPLDNRIENLKIVSRGEHTVIHNTNKDRTSINS